MSKQILFIDTLLIDQPVNEQARSDAASVLQSSKGAKLNIVVDATHSGVLTNRRVYPGKKVMNGFKSFFSKQDGGSSEYGKPVLTHHDEHADPIGRIKSATFTALKTGRDFEQDYLNPDQMGSKGSGVVTVTAEIVDPAAMQKIIDGRYLSVSAGHSTDAMYCSICSNDVYSPECSHIPGKYYDQEGEQTDSSNGMLCYAITNNMTYHELSFVNLPAQPPAKVLEHDWEDRAGFDKGDALMSYLRAKKDIIKAYTLIDENIEFSLLTGSEKSTKQKTFSIASSTADKLRNRLTAETPDTKSEPSNDHSSSSKETQTAEVSEAQKIDTIVSSDKEDKNQLKEQKIMDEKLKELQTEIDSLKATLATAEKEKQSLKDEVVSKTAEIDSIKNTMTELRADISQSLATALASHRIRLGKPDTKEISTDEARKAYIATLAKRSPESLKDSISDLLLEVANTPVVKEEGKAVDAAEVLSGQKLESNTLPVGDQKKAQKKGKQDTLSSVLN